MELTYDRSGKKIPSAALDDNLNFKSIELLTQALFSLNSKLSLPLLLRSSYFTNCIEPVSNQKLL